MIIWKETERIWRNSGASLLATKEPYEMYEGDFMTHEGDYVRIIENAKASDVPLMNVVAVISLNQGESVWRI